jgi:hypothetical protein
LRYQNYNKVGNYPEAHAPDRGGLMAGKKPTLIFKDKHTKETGNFFQMNNAAIQDPGLSWAAKGLLAYFLSLPEIWEVRLTDLFTRSSNGKDSTISAMNELIKAGHVVKIQGENKRRDTRYIVFEDSSKGRDYAGNPNNGE